MTCGYRNCQSRACGSTVRPDGHELAYCVAHEAIARHLPTLRTATCCTSEGCGRPQGSRSPLCKSCRPRYAAWGLDGYPAPQEAPMPTTPEAQTTPVTPYDVLDATAKVWFAMPQEERDYEDNYVPVSEPVPAEAALKRLTSTVDAPHLPVAFAPVDAVDSFAADDKPSVVAHIAAITKIERDLRTRRDAVATRLISAGFEMEYPRSSIGSDTSRSPLR